MQTTNIQTFHTNQTLLQSTTNIQTLHPNYLITLRIVMNKVVQVELQGGIGLPVKLEESESMTITVEGPDLSSFLTTFFFLSCSRF